MFDDMFENDSHSFNSQSIGRNLITRLHRKTGKTGKCNLDVYQKKEKIGWCVPEAAAAAPKWQKPWRIPGCWSLSLRTWMMPKGLPANSWESTWATGRWWGQSGPRDQGQDKSTYFQAEGIYWWKKIQWLWMAEKWIRKRKQSKNYL